MPRGPNKHADYWHTTRSGSLYRPFRGHVLVVIRMLYGPNAGMWTYSIDKALRSTWFLTHVEAMEAAELEAGRLVEVTR